MLDYIAVKLNGGQDGSGNSRRGWLVYNAAGDSLGWVADDTNARGIYPLCSTILDHEGAAHMAATGSTSYPHDVHALINSGRVRVLCSLSVPYSEIREARRTPFKLGGA